MDVEVASLLQKNTIVRPCNQPDNIEHMRDSSIQRKPWGVVYKTHENIVVKNCMEFLQDEHCYKFGTLSGILMKSEM